MAKLRLETTNAVSRTLLIPLWARALEQRERHPILVDPVAAAVVDAIDYDWNGIRLARGDLVQMVVRAREFDRFVRDFLSRHPGACVVQLGAGLDSRFQRVDDGSVRWFDLDLPEVVALRRRLIPESERSRCLAGSVTEPQWMEDVVRPAGSPILFVAEALLPYLEAGQVRELVVRLLKTFPGAELVTDMCTPLALRIDNLHLLVVGSRARMHWSERDPHDVEAWGPGIRLAESFGYFEDPEPRMGLPSWFRRVPWLRRATTIQRYVLGSS